MYPLSEDHIKLLRKIQRRDPEPYAISRSNDRLDLLAIGLKNAGLIEHAGSRWNLNTKTGGIFELWKLTAAGRERK